MLLPGARVSGRPDALKGLDRRRLLIGVGLLATAGAAAAATPRRHEQALAGRPIASVIPEDLPGWRARAADNLVLPEVTEPGSFYDQVLGRDYISADGRVVMLLIAYGSAQSGLMKVHRPEVCYTSAGFRLSPLTRLQIAAEGRAPIPAALFEASRDPRREEVLYWTRVANSFPSSMNEERFATLRSGLHGVIPDGVLVRISTLTQTGAADEHILTNFAQALLHGAPANGRRLLLGTA